MALDSWEDRRKLLVRFQAELIQAFPDESDYNVYIFGSFIRSDFKPGISDIDLIIHCNDFLKRCDIYDFCSLFFKQEHLPLAKNLSDIGDGFCDIAESIKDYCIQNFPELQLSQNLEKILKSGTRKK